MFRFRTLSAQPQGYLLNKRAQSLRRNGFQQQSVGTQTANAFVVRERHMSRKNQDQWQYARRALDLSTQAQTIHTTRQQKIQQHNVWLNSCNTHAARRQRSRHADFAARLSQHQPDQLGHIITVINNAQTQRLVIRQQGGVKRLRAAHAIHSYPAVTKSHPSPHGKVSLQAADPTSSTPTSAHEHTCHPKTQTT